VASCAFFSSLWGCIRASYPVAELERAPATWMDADSAVSGDVERRGDGGVVEDEDDGVIIDDVVIEGRGGEDEPIEL
jgi:hypothetical protein